MTYYVIEYRTPRNDWVRLDDPYTIEQVTVWLISCQPFTEVNIKVIDVH